MKRINNVYDEICSMENLELAERKARKGKSNQYGVKIFDRDKENNLFILKKILVEQTYKTSPYKTFTVFEPKERLIFKLPYFPDRITHHAIMNTLEKVFLRVFTSDTYSCIKGRGIKAALHNVTRALKDVPGTKYCLKIDIKKFYPSVDHEILKGLLLKIIKDGRLLWILGEIIDSAPGLPIGNYLSQYLANFYLTYFDHWIKEDKRIKHYFRYADDMVFFSPDKESLHKLLAEIKEYLSRNLKLELKHNYQIFPVEARGVDFVGYVSFHSYKLLRKMIKQSFARMLSRKNISSKVSSTASYMGWLKWCNSINLARKLLAKAA